MKTEVSCSILEELALYQKVVRRWDPVCLPSRGCIFEQLADTVSPLPCYSESRTTVRYVFHECIDVIYADQGCDPRFSSFTNMIRETGLVFS